MTWPENMRTIDDVVISSTFVIRATLFVLPTWRSMIIVEMRFMVAEFAAHTVPWTDSSNQNSVDRRAVRGVCVDPV
eukprot:SAG31_NODE_41439_length_276_cov_0.581921_1_plen_75_part_01